MQSNTLDVITIPPLSKSEQLSRITEWTKTVMHNPDDYEANTSLLVDQGVGHLENWDREVKKPFVDLHPDPAGADLYAEGSSHHGGTTASRLNLIADLKKIKQSVDPDDKITPRMVVKEFQKYVQGKKERRMRPETPFLQKNVQFFQTEIGRETKRPDMRRERPQFDPNLTQTLPKSARKTKPIIDETSQGQGLSMGSKPADPEFWRRKIRQGMMQTELLMGQLIRQRKEDEQFLSPDNPYIFKPYTTYDSYQPNYSLTGNPGVNTYFERQRLKKSMDRMRQRHTDCFGSCPVPVPALHDDEGIPYAQDTRYDEDSDKEGDEFTPNAYAKPGIRSTSKAVNNPKSLKLVPQSKSNAKAIPHVQKPFNQNQPHRNVEDLHVLFERSPSDKPKVQRLEESTSEHSHVHIEPNQHQLSTNSKHPKSKSQNPNPRPVSLISQNPNELSQSKAQNLPKPSQVPKNTKKVEVLSPSSPNKKALIVLDKLKGGKSEWVQRLVDAKKYKMIKDEIDKKKQKQKQKADTNALYHELLMNRTRLENEVDVEKRNMEFNWRNQGRNYQQGNLGHRVKSQGREREEKHEKKGLVLEYPKWKETPKGLGMWLENVMAKAKDEKKRDEGTINKLLMPLSSYQF